MPGSRWGEVSKFGSGKREAGCHTYTNRGQLFWLSRFFTYQEMSSIHDFIEGWCVWFTSPALIPTSVHCSPFVDEAVIKHYHPFLQSGKLQDRSKAFEIIEDFYGRKSRHFFVDVDLFAQQTCPQPTLIGESKNILRVIFHFDDDGRKYSPAISIG